MSPVSLSLIRECLEIALQAPTGSNAQGWQWMVVQDPVKRLGIAELYRKAWAIYPLMPASAHQVHAADPSMQEVQQRVVSSAEYLANNLEKAPRVSGRRSRPRSTCNIWVIARGANAAWHRSWPIRTRLPEHIR